MVLGFDDTALLEDDTYSYELTQGGVYLKHGFIRLVDGAGDDPGTFDYLLDFLMP